MTVVLKTPAALAALLVAAWILGTGPAPVRAETEHGHAGEGQTAGGHEEGGAALRLEPLKAQGVRVAPVTPRPLGETLRAVAEIRFNEKRRVVLSARSGGWAEKVTVFANQQVKKHQLLASIYSPEFLSAQQEFLLILKRAQRRDDAQNRGLLEDARQRLRILGLTDREIDRLARSGKTYPFQHIHSPIRGTVVKHRLNTGDTVEPGQVLYVIADLRTVWAELALTEAQLGRVRPGQPVSLTVKAYPGMRFEGKVLSLGAGMDEATRTVKARALIRNPDRLLKPGMFAEAEITVASGEPVLAVPAAAVTLFKGQPSVFKLEGEELHPQAVQTGATRGGWTEITAGLAAGERIAVEGVFLLKSLLLKSEMGEGHAH